MLVVLNFISWKIVECVGPVYVSSSLHIINDRTVTHLHIKWGVAVGPTVIGAGTRHLPPSRMHTRPRNLPALAQTYATVVFGTGRVSGEQMLTVGRGLRTTAAVGPG